jgi:hypothetical protein
VIDADVATLTVLGFSLTSLLIGYVAGLTRGEVERMRLGRRLIWMRRERDNARAAHQAAFHLLHRNATTPAIPVRDRHLHSVR